MLRLVEVLLFLAPFAGYGAWLWLGRRHTRALVWGMVGAMLVLVLAAAWLELSRAVPPGMVYVPPRLEDGRVVPGHSVRRAEP